MTPFSEGEFKLHFNHIANKLAENDYILGDRLSGADFGIAFATSMAANLGLLGDYPTLLAYIDRIQRRDAYQRAVEKAVE